MNLISVSKEPLWNLYLGFFCTVIGFFGFTPFKFEGWPFFSNGLHVLLIMGLLLFLRSSRKIGWRLSLEGNVLYYQKFNLYSSWKRRRSAEFSLATQKIIRIKLDGIIIRITYDPSREIRFNTRGLDSLSQKKLYDLITVISKNVI